MYASGKKCMTMSANWYNEEERGLVQDIFALLKRVKLEAYEALGERTGRLR